MRPVSGRKAAAGSSVVMRHCSAAPRVRMRSWARPSSASVAPPPIRSWERTRSMSVISSDTVCSTWMRGFISMNTCSPEAGSTRNSTVPALT